MHGGSVSSRRTTGARFGHRLHALADTPTPLVTRRRERPGSTPSPPTVWPG
ncbi:hypothetical protein C791_4663 [Amycolatopsis azurea DSM 43854]|uniref:Uncharacterized protein n=1 Tax=Amycolatopsis azurea DSM 43854 TaxID=1238180 RepID=M2PM29_9PSEU|nr:hypothetical protein C791_4663 [Amycolatopsis azurea DSM 43854]